MKKSAFESEQTPKKRPKTDLDEKFVSLANHVMQAHGIKSDRAISIELGYRPDFMNRVRNGVQSAPAAAWDALTSKYPEARTVTNISITAKGGGAAVGNVEGDFTHTPGNLGECQQQLVVAHQEIQRLQQQVADKDRLIASQDKTITSQEHIISLLRGTRDRPN